MTCDGSVDGKPCSKRGGYQVKGHPGSYCKGHARHLSQTSSKAEPVFRRPTSAIRHDRYMLRLFREHIEKATRAPSKGGLLMDLEAVLQEIEAELADAIEEDEKNGS